MVRILRVLAPNPGVYTLDGTNTWIVGQDPAVVIDPGPEIVSHLDEVAGLAGSVGAVLVTHDHPDHAPGAWRFAERAEAPLYAFRLPHAEHLRDGQTVTVGDVTLAALHTPGHTSDHVAFHLASHDALFTGDAVLGRGTSFIDPPDGDLVQYLRSLARLQEMGSRTLYPGHGPTVFRAADTLQGYVDHRAERERQVLEALGDEPHPIPELVESIYAEYPSDVYPLAARSVLAHLLKLESEGRVERRGGGEDAPWAVIPPRSCARCGRRVGGRARFCPSCSFIMLQEASLGDDADGAHRGRPEAPTTRSDPPTT